MQAIKYRWEEWEPCLVLRNEERLEKMRLFGAALSMTVGKKHCIGFSSSGRSYPCPELKEIESGYYCAGCVASDDFFPCVQCTGAECINPDRRGECEEENYFIYFAAFNSLLKVGVSFEYRLLERLVEQGADFGAKVGLVKDGKTARLVEQSIRRSLGITDRVTGHQKHENLFCDPNRCAAKIRGALSMLRFSGFSRYLVPPEIYDLRTHYRLHEVVAQPARLDIAERTVVSGRIVAAKGNLLVLHNSSGYYTMNSHSLIGRELCEFSAV